MIAACVISGWVSLSGASNADVRIAEIRKLHTQTNKVVDEHLARHSVYYLSSEGWKKASIGVGNLHSDIDTKAPIEKYDVFIHDRHVVKATFNIETSSGDWSNRKEYYYYPNGKTAFVLEQHLTFNGYDFEKQLTLPNGPFLIEMRYYFDEKGTLIKQLKSAFTVRRKKKVDERFLPYTDLGVLPDVMSLPFYSELVAEERLTSPETTKHK